MSFISALQELFESHKNLENAAPMAAYMKYKFPFLGLKSAQRKSLLKKAINTNKDELQHNVTTIAKALFKNAEREYHYCAMELFTRFMKGHYIPSDLETIRFLICTHSHWDTVDFIAKHCLGRFLYELQELTRPTVLEFSNDSNMWLNRAAILCQLGYKQNTNGSLLFEICTSHNQSKEFFIQKAIGWALREFSKTEAQKVINFVNNTQLKPLSKREALRLLK